MPDEQERDQPYRYREVALAANERYLEACPWSRIRGRLIGRPKKLTEP